MRSFNPYPDERDLAKQTRERHKKPCNFDQKIPVKILSHNPLGHPSKKCTILELFAKPFPPKASLVNAQQKKKRNGESKAKEAERRERKR